MKKVKQNELKNVSGGHCPTPQATYCPNCHAICQPNIDIVSEGSGCSTETFWLCPKCGHKWR